MATRLDVVHYETSPTRRNDLVYALNPLGKVPVLVAADGFCLFDSIVICEYLDGLHDGERMIPASGIARWQALRLQALAQGLADAGIALAGRSSAAPRRCAGPSSAKANGRSCSPDTISSSARRRSMARSTSGRSRWRRR